MIVPSSTLRTRLRLRQLQLMVALSETHSLRRAADSLAMTQPAATKALQELEETIGVKLFVRHARGMEPTIFGEAVTRYAKVVYENMDDLCEELSAIQAGDIGKVRIGAMMAPVTESLTRAIVKLKAAHPKLQVSVQIDTSDVLVQALRQDQLDVVIGRVPYGFSIQDLSFEVLDEEALSIVVRPSHPEMSKKQKPRLKDLAQYPWIILPHPSPMRQIVDQTFREARIDPPGSTVETSSITTTLALLRASDMVAVLSKSVVRYYETLHVLTPLHTELRGQLSPYGLVLKRNRRVTPAMQLTIDALRWECKEHAQHGKG